MRLALCLGSEVEGPVERVIAVEQVEITGDMLRERHQRNNLLSEFHFHES